MNKKGQALIEFVMILPVLLIIILYIIDFTKIGISKIRLESDMDLIVNLYQSNHQEELNNYIDENNIFISYDIMDNLRTITIEKNVSYSMPLLSNIFGNIITTKRIIYEE